MPVYLWEGPGHGQPHASNATPTPPTVSQASRYEHERGLFYSMPASADLDDNDAQSARHSTAQHSTRSYLVPLRMDSSNVKDK